MSLFKTTDELKLYINVDVNMKLSKIKPAIDSAEKDFIKPLLGAAQYDALHAWYIAATPPASNPELEALLPYAQNTLANYAAFYGVEELGVVVGDAGIQQHFSANSQPAPAWKVKDLKLKYLTAGDKAADLMLEFLEVAAIIPDGGEEADRLYKEWYDSDANTSMSGCIVYKTSIANKHIDIGDSRRLFLRLKKRIKEIEASAIKRIICGEQYDALIEQLKGDVEYTDENKALVELLEPIIAKRALYATLPMLPVIITADGLFIQTSNDSVIQKMQASPAQITELRHQLKEAEDIGYLADEARLHTFLSEHIADYPLISGSVCWNADITETNDRWKIDNDPCNKHFST